MTTVARSVSISSDKPHSVSTDVLVVATVPAGDGATLAPGHGLSAAAVRELDSALTALDAHGKAEEVHRVAGVAKVSAPVVVLVGLGSHDGPLPHRVVRGAAAAASRSVPKARSVALALPAETPELVAAAVEGALTGRYTFTPAVDGGAAKSEPTPAVDLALTVLTGAKGAKEAAERAQVLATWQAFARDLVNTAPNQLYPESFAEAVRARAKASKAKISIDVMDENALAEAGCGGILGVGQGSSRPPRIVTVSYKPGRARRGAPLVALVGKGITFDSGGLCIKPSASMLTMKCDMAGAAATAATVFAAAELGLPVAVTAYLCLAENMPGGNAQRPGDVVTMRNRTTVEIIDTDAEGRMVLGDGLCLASETAPDAIVDVATLTGACVMALGPDIFGVMSNDEAFRQRVLDAAGRAGEPAWPLPLPVELRKGLDSQVADLAHKADRWGGALTAGLFLQEFVGEREGADIPWAHVDIAGPAFNEGSPKGAAPKGGTGVAVASLVSLLETYAG